MSSRSEARKSSQITEAERVRLLELSEVDEKLGRAQVRANIAKATAEQDFADHISNLRKIYRLKEGDAIDRYTGQIMRKTGI